jgi:hypothetical protein
LPRSARRSWRLLISCLLGFNRTVRSHKASVAPTPDISAMKDVAELMPAGEHWECSRAGNCVSGRCWLPEPYLYFRPGAAPSGARISRRKDQQSRRAPVIIRPYILIFLLEFGIKLLIYNNFHLVPGRGLEPPRCYPLVPETSASTNSATRAGEEGREMYARGRELSIERA